MTRTLTLCAIHSDNPAGLSCATGARATTSHTSQVSLFLSLLSLSFSFSLSRGAQCTPQMNKHGSINVTHGKSRKEKKSHLKRIKPNLEVNSGFANSPTNVINMWCVPFSWASQTHQKRGKKKEHRTNQTQRNSRALAVQTSKERFV